jgi:hypothetical protein
MYHPPSGVCKLSKCGTAFVMKLSISYKGYNCLNNNKAWIADVVNSTYSCSITMLALLVRIIISNI